ncbi:MAG: aminodeoxychorismate synthase component I [Armatimonadota bacterium]|jgi:para-aminobenzoate synthetase/4-amino-4-deoxychorismate lyase
MRTEVILNALRRPGSALLCGRRRWTDDADAILLREPEQTILTHEPARVPELLEIAGRWQSAGLYVAGFVGYEAGAAFGLPNHPPRDGMPLAWFAAYPDAHAHRLDRAALRPDGPQPELRDVTVALNVSEEQYVAAIARIKELIASGDTYQVNYTCRASFEAEVDPAAYFLAMIRSHPVPYAAFVNPGEAQILSISPELFLRRRGEVLLSKPMKGTRGRGRTADEDAALAEDLVTAEKDRAENLMIVDMVRNDLGRVSRIGSIRVPALFDAEKYRSVWQMTTTVTGEAREGVSLREIFAATFPGASITGAPKHRTMEIIRELEPDPRGVYCGALGLLMPGTEGRPGDFTFNLPIRTLVHREGRFLLGIGAGIVWDSDPRGEYEETLLKSRFAFRLDPDLHLFETILLRDSRELAFLDAHLQRLSGSAEYFDLPCDLDAIRARLDRFAREADAPAVVRLELSEDGAVSLHPRPAPAPLPEPIRVVLSEHRTDPADRLLVHKTSRRGLYDEERARCTEAGFDEVIFANCDGHLTEGAITSVFVRFGERWLTPPVTDGLLPGVWRARFIAERGAEERSIALEELPGADAVVVGNSVRGAIRVGEIVDAVAGEAVWRES